MSKRDTTSPATRRKQRQLSDEADILATQIQAAEGLLDFLKRSLTQNEADYNDTFKKGESA